MLQLFDHGFQGIRVHGRRILQRKFQTEPFIFFHAQLVERLKARILAGTYPPGGHLDSVRDLAAAAGVNPNTMQRALAQLETEGLVRTERTAGRYVTEDTALIEQLRADTARTLASDFLEKMRGIGYSPARAAALLEQLPVQWRHDALCELNAIEQVLNVAQSTVMQDAWARGQKVQIHSWCYSLQNGLITNLHMTVPDVSGLDKAYREAVAMVAARERG